MGTFSGRKNLLGTAGTLRANADFFRGSRILLIHADNWCQCNFRNFLDYHESNRPKGTMMTMMIFKTDNPNSCGIVETDSNGIVNDFHEKVKNPPGNLANGAVYILEPEILEWIESHNEINDFSNQVIPKYLGRIATWYNSVIHRDIGDFKTLKLAQSDSKPKAFWKPNDDWQKWFIKQPIHKQILKGVS